MQKEQILALVAAVSPSGCVCLPGVMEACYSGDPLTQHVGVMITFGQGDIAVGLVVPE